MQLIIKNAKEILLSILLSVVVSNSFSQYKKNAAILEIAGKSFTIFDVSYERYFSEKFHLGTGLGIGQRSNLVYGNGTFIKRFNFTIPVYGAYAFGLKKHHAISEFGLCFQGTYDTEFKTNFNEKIPFISIGYEFKSEGFIFRAPLYLAYIGDNDFLPSVVPWLGLSVGIPF